MVLIQVTNWLIGLLLKVHQTVFQLYSGRIIYVICVCLCIVVSNTYCVVFLVLFVFLLCLVYPMLPVSLEYPFLISPSVFLLVYLLELPLFVLILLLIFLSMFPLCCNIYPGCDCCGDSSKIITLCSGRRTVARRLSLVEQDLLTILCFQLASCLLCLFSVVSSIFSG